MSNQTKATDPQLHPAEGRAYRELYASCRQLTGRWQRLAAAVDDTPIHQTLTVGGALVDELLAELEARTAVYDLHGKPAAQGLGARFGDVRGLVVDKALDTGPAVRLAVLDAEHVVTLLLQLERMAASRGDAELSEFCAGWAKRLRPVVRRVRSAAVNLGDHPDRLAQRLDDSAVGQFANGAGWALGTFGEWFDRKAASVPGRKDDD